MPPEAFGANAATASGPPRGASERIAPNLARHFDNRHPPADQAIQAAAAISAATNVDKTVGGIPK